MPSFARRSRCFDRSANAVAAVAVAATVAGVIGCGGSDATDGGRAAAGTRGDADARGGAWFTDVTEAAGLDFVHESGAAGGYHLPEIMGAGVGLLDYDGDGDLDLYLSSSNFDPERGRSRSDGPTDRLYRNDTVAGGPWRFTDVTETSGLADPGFGMGLAVGDYDGDGDPDVYVTNFGPDRLWRNEGDGTFRDVTDEAGIDVPGWSVSAVFADLDADGDLDLYVVRYVEYDADQACPDRAGRPGYCGPKSFEAVPDVLLRNEGDGRFVDVSEAAGLTSVAGAGLGVVVDDLDGDGRADVYVANDAYENHLWRSPGGDGPPPPLGMAAMEESGLLLGCAFNINGLAEAGMGVIAADLDGDAGVDLFMTHLDVETNTFYRNLGPGRGFIDATGGTGLDVTSRAYTGFGTVAFDADHDGDLDLAVVNGRVNRGTPHPDSALPEPWRDYAEPNLFYVNRGDGRFELSGERAGAFAETIEVSRGLAVGDLDGDGDLDLLVGNVQGRARLYRNDAPKAGRWAIIRVLDSTLGGDAVGARLAIFPAPGDEAAPRRTPLVRTVSACQGYGSSSDIAVHVGLGPAEAIERIEVRWADGSVEVFEDLPVDRRIELERGRGRVVAASAMRTSPHGRSRT